VVALTGFLLSASHCIHPVQQKKTAQMNPNHSYSYLSLGCCCRFVVYIHVWYPAVNQSLALIVELTANDTQSRVALCLLSRPLCGIFDVENTDKKAFPALTDFSRKQHKTK
jgi:hypothetical protein